MSFKTSSHDLGLPSRQKSLEMLNQMLEHLNKITFVDGKPVEILYPDFVTAILTFAGMSLSRSIFNNAVKEIKQHDLKNVATELTIAFRQTLDKSLEIEYASNLNKEIH